MLEQRGKSNGSVKSQTGISWFESKVFAWSDNPSPRRHMVDFACAFLFLVLATLIGDAFFAFDMEACIVITYVLAVLCISLLTVGRA